MGKSTLLKILVNQIAADAGKIEWGHAVEFGYLAQDHHETNSMVKKLLWNGYVMKCHRKIIQ